MDKLKDPLSPSSLFESSRVATRLMKVYFVSSILMSLLIFLRLQILPTPWMVILNAIFYYLTYTVVGIFSLVLLILPFFSYKQKSKIKQVFCLMALTGTLLLTYFLLILPSFFGILPEYVTLPIPVILVFVVYSVRNKPQKVAPKKRATLFFGAALVFALLIPFVTAFGCYGLTLSQATNIKDANSQALFIRNTVAATTFDLPFSSVFMLRANQDFQKLLMVGVGACGETAMSSSTYLKNLGFETREVTFPGEDHVFVEVKINGTWLVLDPGYSPPKLLTRSERASERTREVGTISYVSAYSDSSFIELTAQYVDTDMITIEVAKKGEPVAGASINLVHTLRYDNTAYDCQLPGWGLSFHTDINGTVTLHLGKLEYNKSFERTDAYYWIYINGHNTGCKVTSTGTGETHLVQIEIG
jgi:hypothetical protein